jgi:hypothetical protein
MLTKETVLQKYEECKLNRRGDIPKRDEFLEFANINERQLAKVFGSSPYSKLQNAAGDTSNKLQMERTPHATIMQRYGELVTELGVLPAIADWHHRGMTPTESGLRNIHEMKWSELPTRFVEWVTANKISGFDKAVEIIAATIPASKLPGEKVDKTFLRLVQEIRNWTPARRRNSEESYKVELRGHLKSLKYEMNEEYGESKYDLLVTVHTLRTRLGEFESVGLV